jgi:RimJ/RimL family protein N-acetyltransferase
MIEIRDAVQADLDYVVKYPINEAAVAGYKDMKLSGWAKTALLDGDILGVGGCVVFWKGVAQGWYALSKHAEYNKIGMVHCLEEVIALAIKELKLHRLETTIRKDFVHAKKFIEYAGFELETPGAMKKYTEDQKDTYLYAMVI